MRVRLHLVLSNTQDDDITTRRVRDRENFLHRSCLGRSRKSAGCTWSAEEFSNILLISQDPAAPKRIKRSLLCTRSQGQVADRLGLPTTGAAPHGSERVHARETRSPLFASIFTNFLVIPSGLKYSTWKRTKAIILRCLLLNRTFSRRLV